MRILLVTNKTLPRNGKNELDPMACYLVRAMTGLGHVVSFYDTCKPDNTFFNIYTDLNPDLVFCCLTGNPNHTPYEPVWDILKVTRALGTPTFNWFCDDTWRFESFSKNICWLFNHCSTPEPKMVEAYESIGYDNIHIANWHASIDFFPKTDKDIDISFVGGMNQTRKDFFSGLTTHITTPSGLSLEELFKFYCRSKIGVNLSVNDNDPEKKTQMKLRPFELAAAKCMILSEYHHDMEWFFEPDKEMVTFKDREEFESKANFYLAHPDLAKQIANAGHERFLKDHESKVRISELLKDIV